MRKKVIPLLVGLVLLGSVFFSGCFDNSSSAAIPEEVKNVTYIFNGRSEEENTKLTRWTEALLAAAYENFDQNVVTQEVTFGSKGEALSMWIRKITIDPEDPYTLGALLYYESATSLPAWLCAGLELYWLEDKGLNRFEFDKNAELTLNKDLGDEWFIEGYWENGLGKEHFAVMYGFIQYLDKTDRLAEVIALYRAADKTSEAEALRATAWKEFTGRELDTKIIYTYHFGKDLAFSTATEQANYKFDPAKWTWEMVTEYIETMEIGIVLAEEWLDYPYDEPIDIYLYATYVPDIYGGYAFPDKIELYNRFEWHPYHAIAHEAAHYILIQKGEFPVINFLKEGLAEAVQYLTAPESSKIFDRYVESLIISGAGDWYKEIYLNKSGSSFDADLERGTIDLLTTCKLAAMRALTQFEKFGQYGPYATWEVKSTDVPAEIPYGYLRTYQTACSFSLFLLEKGSKADLLALSVSNYDNIEDTAKNIYGKDMAALIEEWMNEYLNYPEWKELMLNSVRFE